MNIQFVEMTQVKDYSASSRQTERMVPGSSDLRSRAHGFEPLIVSFAPLTTAPYSPSSFMDAEMEKQRRISEADATTLDTRGMQSPEPILAILKEVSKSNDALRVRLDNLPMQLYDLLSQHGFIFEYFKNADGTVEGLVRPRDLSANASH